MRVRIGTRGSRLALTQAEMVRSALNARFPGLQAEIMTIKTRGDRILDSPLSKIGGKGLFIREIEEALAAGRIELAVHSLKDLPTTLPGGLVLGGALAREDPRDALVSREGQALEELPDGERVGTSSLRRAAQLLSLRPGLRVVDLRGNVGTRLSKMEHGECDALILAACALDRAGLGGRISERLRPELMLPAACQGIIGIETRRDDRRTAELVAGINDHRSYQMAAAERTFLSRLEGGCQVPAGCLSAIEGENATIEGLVASLDGRRLIRRSRIGPAGQLAALAEELAEQMLAEGGGEILEGIRNSLAR
jgi:hydroxymethylbilane synthase